MIYELLRGRTSTTDLIKNALDISNFQKKISCLNIIENSVKAPLEIDETTQNYLAENFDEYFPFVQGTKLVIYEGPYFNPKLWNKLSKLINSHSQIDLYATGDINSALNYLFPNDSKNSEKLYKLEKILYWNDK